jgi:dihydrofolate reductase
MINLILAASTNWAVGRTAPDEKGRYLPFVQSEDLKFFKRMTLNHKIVTGYNTFKTFPGLLPNRETIILSRKTDLVVPGATVVNTIEKVLSMAREEDIFIIGGVQVYEQFIGYVDKIYLTRIHADIVENGQGLVFLPESFRDSLQEHFKHLADQDNFFPKDEKNEHDMTFEVWERV